MNNHLFSVIGTYGTRKSSFLMKLDRDLSAQTTSLLDVKSSEIMKSKIRNNMTYTYSAESLCSYIKNNQVVCQYSDELIEVSQAGSNLASRLCDSIHNAESLEIVKKEEMKSFGYDLSSWSNESDVLVWADGVLICMNKKEFEQAMLISQN